MERTWLKGLVFLLFCYALLQRGFSYLFLGEIWIVIGIPIFLLSGRLMVIGRSAVLMLWALFAFWGLCRAVPFLSTYHFFVIRDSVLWGYGLVALFIVAFVRNSSQIAQVLSAYRKFLRWFMFVMPVLLFIFLWVKNSLPVIPWSGAAQVPIFSIRDGATAVQMSAGAVFLLLLPQKHRAKRTMDISLLTILGIVGFGAALIAIAIGNRAGFLIMVVPIILISILKYKEVAWKAFALSIFMAGFGILVLSMGVITVRSHGRNSGRTFTVSQLGQNLTSIVGGERYGVAGDTQATKTWRTIWWAEIVHYTVFGPYRWTGKGFGINLAQSDGPPGITPEDTALRSPHNGSMTVLARMGVPGLILWIALNATFAISLFRAYRRTASARLHYWSAVNLWILCYWLSLVINMSFEVYIEGPVGGIWFWSIIGFGVAVMRIQANESRQLLRQSRLRVANVAQSRAAITFT
ncbi:MAG: O-antigen ligase family protein [Terriglobia bacterium]